MKKQTKETDTEIVENQPKRYVRKTKKPEEGLTLGSAKMGEMSWGIPKPSPSPKEEPTSREAKAEAHALAKAKLNMEVK